MSTPPPTQARRSSGESKKVTPPASSIVTRNGARKAKIQTRAMSAGAKPSALVIAAKRKAQQKKKHGFDTELRDHYQIAMDSKTKVKGPTGLVTEPRMAEHRCLWDDQYPECPERLTSVIQRCHELNLIEQCKQYPPRAATKEELCALHSPSVYDMMETTHQNNDLEYLEELSAKYDAVYIHPSTHELALLAAGSTIDLIDRIVSGELQNGAALVRPPGHHAMRAEPCGYCFYNNVALAAKHAIDVRGVNRILIVDWDVHHGQATQQMFYNDPRVVYFSIHRYEHGSFWPNLRQSNFHYVGAGRGKGYNFNVPLNKTGMTDGDYLAIWHQLLLPMAFEYQPELIIISAGYDAAYGCPEGEMELTPAVYGHLTQALMSVLTDLTIPQHAVGYIYDTAMLKHKNVCEPGHVECPERIMRIHERHRDFALLDRMRQLSARPATDDDILAVHTEGHLNRLKELATTKLRNLNIQKEDYDSVYFHPDSLESATVAAGCVLQMVDAVLSNEVGSGVCVIRPPGHHADDDIPAGFCLLNNAAAAANYALHTHGLSRVLILDWDVHHGNGTQRITYDDNRLLDHLIPLGFCLLNNAAAAAKYVIHTHGLDRVLILDWDVHHGNGTQRITYDDNRILYMSIHRYDHGSFFPHSKDADHTAVGEGKGEGFNVNVPWNKRNMGDTEYLTAFTQVILPIAYAYNPQLVIVSAGFDACVGDPLGGCKVTPECYGRMTQLLRGLAGGRVILCLEGGYNITSISYAMTMCSKALLGDPILHHYDPKTPCHWAAIDSINDVINTHKQYWKCLKFQVALPSDNVLEPPLPSRGLVIEQSELEVSACSEDLHNDSTKSSASHLESSLEASMSNLNLNLEKKCSDGIHCGTDDEDEKPKPSKSSEPSASGSSSSPDSKKEQSNPIKPAQAGSSGGKKATLVEYLAENMQSIVDGDMFAVIPQRWCPHLDSLYTIPDDVKFEQGVKCIECDHTEENWVCLHCYVTACARSINGHMQAHCATTGHALVLSLVDLSVWCNICDAYVDNSLLYDAKNNAHRCKFGEDMPWCYKTDIHMQ
ncbi:hypothetical protein B5X24_HaOG212826 [Helicoverpa armigera]|nr:hypothetical protein B5X24_HaOG212826 [Helicoverpa armigera]